MNAAKDSGKRETNTSNEHADAGAMQRHDARWYPVYAAVIVFATLVIAALWWFSRAFSS